MGSFFTCYLRHYMRLIIIRNANNKHSKLTRVKKDKINEKDTTNCIVIKLI